MTPDKAIEVLADHVTGAAVQEVIDNGLHAYLDAELDEGAAEALRLRLLARVAAGPDPQTTAEALRLHRPD